MGDAAAGAEGPLTLRDVLERHGAEVWHHAAGPGGQRSVRLPLPPAAGRTGSRAEAARRTQPRAGPSTTTSTSSAYGDSARELHERRLSDLAYTVFDTETTGLEPSAGDEIISIGAVRIVNGRLLKNEVFEQLVNPRRARYRAIRPASTASTARRSRPSPGSSEVLPAFHRFCEDTVLVAHNAAFDMRFLELKEAATGVRFTQPVLDTLLLSAMLHPSLDDHRLETMADRLGVQVIGRHTALGDALLEAEIFLRLLPLLAARGIVTLRQALEASRQTY